MIDNLLWMIAGFFVGNILLLVGLLAWFWLEIRLSYIAAGLARG